MAKANEHYERKVMSSIKKNWQSDVSYIEGPNYGEGCLVDSSGLIVAWIHSYERADPEAELCIDIRHLLGVMPMVLATGRPLVIVVAYPDDVRYVVWRRGTKDFCYGWDRKTPRVACAALRQLAPRRRVCISTWKMWTKRSQRPWVSGNHPRPGHGHVLGRSLRHGGGARRIRMDGRHTQG
jgi:hypothetical protein